MLLLDYWTSRLALNVSLFKGKRILEIGAGNALCGVTIASFASHVTLSDFNEIVLNNIDSIVEINSGEYQMTHCSDGISSSCLGDNNDRIEVFIFIMLPSVCGFVSYD
jgi:predicted nicotinamide N-methyase